MTFNTVKVFAISVLLLILIDIPWLYINQTWAGEMLRNIQNSPMKIRPFPALLVYIFMAYLLYIPKSYGQAFLMGAAVYGVYDATNYATITDYDPLFAIADTTWGGILMSTAWWIKNRYLRL